MTRAIALIAWVLTALALGCAGPNRGPYEPVSESDRDPRRAQQLTARAVELMSSRPAEAEKLLREALTADLFHGPAHNNLGVLLLSRGMLYDAAGEFEWAKKLLPGHPDPRVNLALVYERAGRVQDALASYGTALDVYPDYLAALQGITRLQVRTGQADEKTVERLGQVAMRGENDRWREWAIAQLAKRSP